jgi:hypothetical protein
MYANTDTSPHSFLTKQNAAVCECEHACCHDDYALIFFSCTGVYKVGEGVAMASQLLYFHIPGIPEASEV